MPVLSRVSSSLSRVLDIQEALDELARSRQGVSEQEPARPPPKRPSVRALEKRLWAAVGAERRAEAEEVLATARVSWRLRDDDNLLLSRVESQLFRSVDLALDRLRAAERLEGQLRRAEETIPAVVAALRDKTTLTLSLADGEERASEAHGPSQETPRQLVGQPAAPGLAAHLVPEALVVQEHVEGVPDLAEDGSEPFDIVEPHVDLLGEEDRLG